MQVISLFSGIGGFELAAEWMGWQNIVSCEINPFGRKELEYYWPNAYHHDDIKTLNYDTINNELTKRFGAEWRNDDIILTGGFPCQPYSLAGKRKGKDDERHLWPEMLRIIREVKPSWIVGENVLGIVNWNGGLVFHEVQTDLEAEGYEVQPYVLPAVSVNAPHRRDRVWFVAYCNKPSAEHTIQARRDLFASKNGNGDVTNTGSEQLQDRTQDRISENTAETGAGLDNRTERLGNIGDAADTDNQLCERGSNKDRPETTERHFSAPFQHNTWQNFPTQSPICTGNDGLSANAHTNAISEDRNNMDRSLVTKLCLEEGRLKVDFETGKIYSLKQRGKEGQSIELLGSDCNGYIVHGIRYNGFKIQLRAHQIVWIAANGLYDKNNLMIDHINRDKKDNRLSNLRLVNAKENRDNSTEYKGKLSDNQKDMMVWLNKEDGIPIRELAEDFGISKSRVHQIISEHNGIYGITFSKWRNESIKAAGNAVVPKVVYQIFKAIEAYNKL